MFKKPLTRTNVFDILDSRKGGYKMEKFLKKYGVILLLYLVIVGGVILLNERCRLLNENAESSEVIKK